MPAHDLSAHGAPAPVLEGTAVEDPILDSKYEVLAKLREGGMGALYKVRHRLLDEVRVIKVLHSRHEGDADLRQRFLREARAATRLRHPNVVQVLDFSLDASGVGLIVMEHIAGSDLRRLIRAGERPSIALGLEIARQGLRALAYLHRQGFVHRDVSPDNLMLSFDVDGAPHLKLIDRGIAKNRSAGDLTQSGAFLGKFRYASPEQFGVDFGCALDGRSDLYCFGLVLYEVLTGLYALPGSRPSQLVSSHLMRSPIDFEESDPEGRIPEPLRAMVLRALEKEPDLRPPSADAWLAEVEALQAHHPVDAGVAVEVADMLERAADGEDETWDPGSTQSRIDRNFGLGSVTPEPSAPEPIAPGPSPPVPARSRPASGSAPGSEPASTSEAASADGGDGGLAHGSGACEELEVSAAGSEGLARTVPSAPSPDAPGRVVPFTRAALAGGTAVEVSSRPGAGAGPAARGEEDG
ncbi:MAG: protein kinase, partial [Holophagales bacterium]|nr:protein kinase [Holophagales bacterium]